MDEAALTTRLADHVNQAERLDDLTFAGLPADVQKAFILQNRNVMEVSASALLIAALVKGDLQDEHHIPFEAVEEAATELMFLLGVEASFQVGLVDAEVPEHLLGLALSAWATDHRIDTAKLPPVVVHYVEHQPHSMLFSPGRRDESFPGDGVVGGTSRPQRTTPVSAPQRRGRVRRG